MKTLKITLAIIALLLFSCNKDDNSKPEPKVYVEENPMAGFLALSGFNASIWSFSFPSGFFEIGFTFKPLVNGKINAIVIKIPQPRASIRVIIWDVLSQQPIRTEIVNVTSGGTEVAKQINSLELVKNKEYVISMYSDIAYVCSINPLYSVDANFPIVVNNISILKSNDGDGTLIYPAEYRKNVYQGNCSFNFQQTE